MLPILFVDDDRKEQAILRQVITDYSVHSAYSAEEARGLLRGRRFSAIILDIHLPDMDGLQLLEELRLRVHLPPVILLSAYGNSVNVVRAMKAGAVDFIPKPFGLDHLKRALATAVSRSRHLPPFPEEPAAAESAGGTSPRFCIGTSQTAICLRDTLRLYAEADAAVLLSGESGSGKEVAALEIHARSTRARGPFLAVNCGAIPHTLVESELYGTVEGVYTGAGNRSGYFEQAHGGVLFMDEIGEMPLESQVKLLRIIECRRFRRLGGRREIEADVRVIAATNRDLAAQVEAGLFRADLYHRLNILNLRIPPLRDRKEDIPALVEHFLRHFRISGAAIEEAALLKLIDYDWPGNIRELKNTIERALVFSRRETIRAEHIILGEILFPLD
jgi:DNA-binding NtrC family response regulator